MESGDAELAFSSEVKLVEGDMMMEEGRKGWFSVMDAWMASFFRCRFVLRTMKSVRIVSRWVSFFACAKSSLKAKRFVGLGIAVVI